ncbi:unnamed protein product [Rotaria sp. Silwood2]|nr:unnamed protein product [Rotaria sp. Silwood2]
MATNLIIKCNLPLSLVENPAFREFMKECYPKWQPISTKKLKSDIISSFKTRIHKIICDTLEIVNDLTLTIDAWSHRRGRSFLGITCHFIDNKMVPQAFLIDFVRMKSPHTSDNIQRLTENVLDRFNIKEKVFRIITDNASSMIKAYRFGLAVDGDYQIHDDQCDKSTTDDCSTFDNYDQLEGYLNDPMRSNFSDYWLRSQLTSLKKLVAHIFSVQASSAPIERVFSHAGLILSSRRTRMNEQLFRDIAFLKANQCLI